MGTDDVAKRRTRKAQKFQRAIVGMSLDDIKKKKAMKPELRQAAKEAAAKEARLRLQAKGKTSKPAAKGGAKPKAEGGKDQSKVAKSTNAPAKGGTKKNPNTAR